MPSMAKLWCPDVWFTIIVSSSIKSFWGVVGGAVNKMSISTEDFELEQLALSPGGGSPM